MIQKQDLIYPELSYKLVGLAYNVFNELGHGHLEKIYQKAYAKELKEAGIIFKEQAPYQVIYKEEIIGNNFLDFLIEEKVIIELKRSDFYSKKYIDQVSNYIKVSNLKLAILINFTSNGVRIKRIVNESK
ncbi:MAG: GxxExxY protein [Bacteroidia bacterium]|jgi:GxxExxY protein|nr:GxxExxY protein [Bacteroidia bacterium]